VRMVTLMWFDCSITYIPASDAAVFKATAITRLAKSPDEVESPSQPQPAARSIVATRTEKKANGSATTVISIGQPPPPGKTNFCSKFPR
jgi:hypothetical protein